MSSHLVQLETIDILHLVAGGVGITFCLPLLTDIMRRSCLASVLPTESDDNEKQIPQNSATKQLRLTWIIKSKGEDYHHEKKGDT